MPELPEVETIRRALQLGGRGGPPVVGWKIAAVELLWEPVLATTNEADFLEQVRGQTISSVQRRAKFLDLELNRHHILIHLRMSGDIRVEEVHQEIQKHDRAVLRFDNGYRLVFNDSRKFGRMWFVEDPLLVIARLGPEPFDESLGDDEFYELVHRKKRQIKPLLMDQSVLGGMGNIYTDEALFQARIHPLRNSATLSREETGKLLLAIRDQLMLGIERNGASIDWVYRGGDFQNSFQVYGKNGQNCPNCGTVITKILVGQRGTHYCPTCQPLSDPVIFKKEG